MRGRAVHTARPDLIGARLMPVQNPWRRVRVSLFQSSIANSMSSPADPSPIAVSTITDRRVRIIGAEPGQQESRCRFSEQDDYPRLILLGDPGAGKTRLFKHFAAREPHAFVVEAHALLGAPGVDIAPGATVYIDGLDETRKYAHPRATVDALFAAIKALQPAKVRIACRAVDWHGSFGRVKPGRHSANADYRVLTLEPLDEAEQIVLLRERGVGDPHGFIEKAKAHGLSELLEHPLSLDLLAKAVADERWPANRHALFDVAIDRLLTEHNEDVHLAGVEYASQQLRSTAGALCAMRLLSDVAGIALTPPGSERTPFYGAGRLWEAAKAEAALGRLVFTADGPAGSMDASHKSIAEFLAAEWLAEQVASGLPLSRVRALIGIDGLPPTPLRGIHAWLAVLLDKFRPDEAGELIAADPIGVLAYADASRLKLTNKRRLLLELAQPAHANEESDRRLWSSLNIGALSCDAMAPDFRKVLAAAAATAPRPLALTLRAVMHGEPRPELIDELLAIASDPAMPGNARHDSLHALLRLPAIPSGKLDAGYGKLGCTEDDLRLRGMALPCLLGTHRGLSDVSRLLSDLLGPRKGLVLNKKPYLSLLVPPEQLTVLLDDFADAALRRSETERVSQRDLPLWTIDHLVTMALACSPPADQLRGWLRARYRFMQAWRIAGVSNSILDRHLRSDPGLCGRLADLVVGELAAGQAGWDAVTELMTISDGALSPALVSERVMHAAALTGSCHGEALDTAAARLAEMATQETAVGPSSSSHGLAAPSQVADSPALTALEPLDEAACAELAQAGRIFYGLDGASTDDIPGIERLRQQFGEQRALEIRAGLVAYAFRADVFPEPAVLALAQAATTSDACFAVSAGLALSGQTRRNAMPPELIEVRIMLDSLTRQALFDAGLGGRAIRTWIDHIRNDHPVLAAEAYTRLIRACGGQGNLATNAASGLIYLANHRQAALSLLGEYPLLPDSAGLELLEVLVDAEARDVVRGLAGDVLGRLPENMDSPAYCCWLAIGTMLDPGAHFARFDRHADRAALGRAFGWLMKFPAFMNAGLDDLEASQVARLVRLMHAKLKAELAQALPHGAAWWTAHAIRIYIGKLKTRPGVDATDTLRQLASDPALTGMKEELAPALSEQLRLTIDSQYQELDWKRVERSLRNGPPADHAELQELVLDYIKSVQSRIAGSPLNIHKWFWNEGSHGSVYSPKPEESCRDVLMGLLEPMLAESVDMAREEAMPGDQRTDIGFNCKAGKVVVELKRDSHDELWTAIASQLERYTKHERANGYGIYGVFWFGPDGGRGSNTPKLKAPPKSALPDTPEALLKALRAQIPPDAQHRLKVFVIDVSATHHAQKMSGTSDTKASAKAAA
jgi:hypothetical protein